MQTEYTVCMSQLIRQHEEIKVTSTHALDLLHAWTEEGNTTQLDELRDLVVRFCRLVINHTKQEEETIIPLLKEIYGTDENLTEFVKGEHIHLISDLTHLAETIINQVQPTHETIQLLSNTLNQLLEHKFVEEQALYPLIQTYLNKKNLS